MSRKRNAGPSKRQPTSESEERKSDDDMDAEDERRMEELLAADEDADKCPTEMIGQCQQDPRERREIRQKYRELILDTQSMLRYFAHIYELRVIISPANSM